MRLMVRLSVCKERGDYSSLKMRKRVLLDGFSGCRNGRADGVMMRIFWRCIGLFEKRIEHDDGETE